MIEHIDERPKFRLIGDVLYYQDGLCVSDMQDLEDEILIEAHHGRHSIYPGTTKM